MKTVLTPLVGNLCFNKTTYFIKQVQQLRINSGNKQNIEHDYEWIYDMFDLSKILEYKYVDKACMIAISQQQL